MIQRGYREFTVDLQMCELMDSTFMGTLAGVALRLREMGQGTLKAINVNERNSALLGSLGLDQLFTVEPMKRHGSEEIPAEAELHKTPVAKGDADLQKETVLEAHEALAEISSANAVKFKDVLDFLRQELNAPASGDN